MDLRFAIGAGGKALDQAGLKFDIADFDGYAVEAALQLVEAHGSGEVVVVISLGPDAVQETLRKALGMGADRAMQLKADERAVRRPGRSPRRSPPSSRTAATTWSSSAGWPSTAPTSTVGADDGAAAGAALRDGHLEARHRRRPRHRGARSSRAAARRSSSRCRPSSPSTRGWRARASRRSRGSWPPRRSRSRSSRRSSAPRSLTVDAMALPPERPPGRIVGEGADAVPELVRLLQTEAKVL